MRASLCILLSLLIVAVGHALAQAMPAVVREFAETQGLWNSVHNEGVLPAAVRNISPSHWQYFLQHRGEDVIIQKFQEIPRGATGPGMFQRISKMKRFAKNPAQLGELDIVEGHHKNIASALIEEYAKHRKANPHVYAVHDYMHDDGPALIPRK